MIAFVVTLAACGAIGAIARAMLEVRFASADPSVLNRGVLLANLIGCLLLGLGAGIADLNVNYLLAHGLTGALTTWSAFSLDTARLLRAGRHRLGLLTIALHVGGGLLAALLGRLLAALLIA